MKIHTTVVKAMTAFN